jgi:hypothetical protein
MPKARTQPEPVNGEKRRGKGTKAKAPAQPKAARPEGVPHAPASAAKPATPQVRGPADYEVRERLEAALAEERLEQTLFGPSGRAETITVSVTPPVLNDLAFLAGYFEQGYGQGRRTNKSALVRLAIRTLRYWLDPTGMPPQSRLPFSDGDAGPASDKKDSPISTDAEDIKD